MLPDEILLTKARDLIEKRLGWGASTQWTNQDFVELSNRIQSEIGASVSPITLKRLWGKVKYDGLPQVYTLNVLSKFAGFESWRDFKTSYAGGPDAGAVIQEGEDTRQDPRSTKRKPAGKRLILPAIGILIALSVGVWLGMDRKPEKESFLNPANFSLSVRPILGKGIPNSVVFDYDAEKAPGDSVIIQQSWDTLLRTTVSKSLHQRTLIYYFPGFFNPKLLVGNQIVKELDLLLPSDGWLTAVNASPMPVYFRKNDVQVNGKLALSLAKIREQHILMSPQAPELSYINVQNFGEIYTDAFTFEASLRNDFREGSSVCQLTNLYLLCEGTAIGIPLCAKGCESALKFFFTDYVVSGKLKDLSNFGVDFSDFVKVRVESENGQARIFLNDKLSMSVPEHITKSKIIGIDFVFQGTGSVDYVRLSNKEVSFVDEF